LEKALLDHLQSFFLLELGTGFCVEARQRRISVGNEPDYLVIYHWILRCRPLIELKVHLFRHGDAGQMNFYLNYWKAQVMAEGDTPPVDLLLCTDEDQTKMEPSGARQTARRGKRGSENQYATGGLDHQLFVSRYPADLLRPEQLAHLIETDRAAWEPERTPACIFLSGQRPCVREEENVPQVGVSARARSGPGIGHRRLGCLPAHLQGACGSATLPPRFPASSHYFRKILNLPHGSFPRAQLRFVHLRADFVPMPMAVKSAATWKVPITTNTARG